MTIVRYFSTLLSAAPLLLLVSGCGDDTPKKARALPEIDPAMAQALADEIMVDPDLAGQNPASAGIAVGTHDASLPPDNDSPAEIEAARRSALELVGGTDKMKVAPAPRVVGEGKPAGSVITAAARAATVGSNGADCAGKVEYTTAWAAKMPAAFPVYPRGNVKEAAGTDKDGCTLRAVTYTTPVAHGEVIDFYYTRAAAAGFKTDRVRQGNEEILGGARGGVSYLVSARPLTSGRTEVDLITSGR